MSGMPLTVPSGKYDAAIEEVVRAAEAKGCSRSEIESEVDRIYVEIGQLRLARIPMQR